MHTAREGAAAILNDLPGGEFLDPADVWFGEHLVAKNILNAEEMRALLALVVRAGDRRKA